MKLREPSRTEADWPTAMATVTECRFDAGVGRAVAFGLPTFRRFRITYNYMVDGEPHTGSMRSEKAMPQGTLFPIHYDPRAAHQHRVAGDTNAATSGTSVRRAQLMVGIIGSVVLSLAWLLVLRGCH